MGHRPEKPKYKFNAQAKPFMLSPDVPEFRFEKNGSVSCCSFPPESLYVQPYAFCNQLLNVYLTGHCPSSRVPLTLPSLQLLPCSAFFLILAPWNWGSLGPKPENSKFR